MRTQRINKREQSLMPQYANYISSGLGPAQANRLIKEQHGKGIRPAVANRYAKQFSAGRNRSVEAFDLMGRRTMTENQIGTTYVGYGTRFKYQYRFNYYVRDRDTQELLVGTQTIGADRLYSPNYIKRVIKDRLLAMQLSEDEKYLMSVNGQISQHFDIQGVYRAQQVF